MKKDHNGIIKPETYLVLNHYNEEGKLCSLILENNEWYFLEKKPIEIIEDSIAYYGSSLEGARHAARAALGNIQLPPVQVCAKQGMYWFPTQGSVHEDCVWFSFSHLKRIKKINSGKIVVILENNVQLEIALSLSRMEKRISNTYCFIRILEARINPEIELKNTQYSTEIVHDPILKHYYIDTEKGS